MKKNSYHRIELYDRSWLAAIRVTMNLTQKDVAEACDISVGAYCRIERGLMLPNVKIAVDIADLLGFDVHNFKTEKRIA